MFLCFCNVKENKLMYEIEISDKYFLKFIVGDDILNVYGINLSNNELKLV